MLLPKRRNQHMNGVVILLVLWFSQSDAWSWFSASKNGQPSDDDRLPSISSKGSQFSLETHSNPKGGQLVDTARAKMLSSNSCWQNAYHNLFSGCSEIIANKEMQSRLAWYLSDCFQKESGRPPFPSCESGVPMVKCLKSLDEFAHKIYLEFFLESNSICHQLQAEAFKHETERLVNQLKQSAQVAEEKLDSIEEMSELLLNSSNQIEDSLVLINSNTQEVAHLTKQVENQITDVLIHSKAVFDQSKDIIASQLKLQETQVEMTMKMDEGMTLLQESYEDLGDGMEKLKKNALDIEKEIQVVGNSMSTKMQNLQSKTDDIGNIAGVSLEKQKQLLDGQSVALEGLHFLTKFQTQAMEESRRTLQNLAEFGQKQQDELLHRQEQLQQTHDHLIRNSKSILKAQEAFESKQANMFNTLEKLFSLLNSIVLESRFIKTSIHYFGVVLFTYWLTSAKQISNVRAHFYLGICLTFAIESVAMRLYPSNLKHQSWIGSNIFWLRSILLLCIALSLILYSVHNYRDYEQLNHQLLLALRDKIDSLEKNIVTIYLTLENDDLSSWANMDWIEDEDLCNDPDYIFPEEVGENSVTTATSRKYDLRPRLLK